MTSMLWRVLIAVLALVIFNLLLPPVLRVIGLPISGDVILILRICVAALAVFYIVRGAPPVIRP